MQLELAASVREAKQAGKMLRNQQALSAHCPSLVRAANPLAALTTQQQQH